MRVRRMKAAAAARRKVRQAAAKGAAAVAVKAVVSVVAAKAVDVRVDLAVVVRKFHSYPARKIISGAMAVVTA